VTNKGNSLIGVMGIPVLNCRVYRKGVEMKDQVKTYLEMSLNGGVIKLEQWRLKYFENFG